MAREKLRRGGVAIILLLPLAVLARSEQDCLPDQLEPVASVICNGRVISVQETKEKKDFQCPEVAPSLHSKEVVMLAKIKVLHVFKGQAPDFIEFRYRTLALSTTQTTVIVDGREHVNLQENGRYRFFLRPADRTGCYVDALEGKYDDNPAVEALAPTEPDASPFLKKGDAIKFAFDHLRAKKPVGKFDVSRADVSCWPEADGGATWLVMVTDDEERSAQVFVHADLTINETITKLNERHGN